MDRMTYAFDPGNDTGWSKWAGRTLVACGLCHPDDYPNLPFIVGCKFWLNDQFVIELPEDYGSNRKVDPNKLRSLILKVGRIIGAFEACYNLHGIVIDFKQVEPKQWKGQVPKPIHHDRELAKLSAEEANTLRETLSRVPEGKRHDVKDAVCLGLWRLGR